MSTLTAFEELSGKLALGHELVPSRSPQRMPVIDPATEQTIGEIAECTPAEVERVIALSNQAQKAWAKTNSLVRVDAMHECARLMRERREHLAEMLTREMGKTYKESMDEVEWSASAMDYYCEVARHDAGKVIHSNIDAQLHFTVKEPLGVVGIILPFNYPLVLLAWEASAAIATGNTVIVKPSQYTSLVTLELMKAFEPLPAGVVQCVTGVAKVGQQLVESPDTHMVCFTGGIETGRSIARTCADRFKRTLIEASGNDPFVISDKAPLDVAARGSSFAAFMNCGQICVSSERFYVHEAIHDEFVEKMVAQARSVRIGNGLDKVDMGPLVAERERERYERVLARALEQGAEVATGGGRPSGLNRGWFVDTTVLTGVTPEMDILHKESFGPVAPICKVSSFEEGLRLANDSRYGLGSCVYTSDLNEAMQAVNQLEAGMVWVNAPLLDNDAGPFGGRKMSGMGRQLGAEGLETFRHTKLAMIDPACNPQDFWWFPYRDAEMYPGERE